MGCKLWVVFFIFLFYVPNFLDLRRVTLTINSIFDWLVEKQQHNMHRDGYTCTHGWNNTERKVRENITSQTFFSLNGFQMWLLIRLNHSHVLWQVAAQPNQRIHSKITSQTPVNFGCHFSSGSISWGQQLGDKVCKSRARAFRSLCLLKIQFSLPCLCSGHHTFMGFPNVTFEIKCPLCCVLLHAVGLSLSFLTEFCFLIAMHSGPYVLADALEKLAQGRPTDSVPGRYTSFHEQLFTHVHEGKARVSWNKSVLLASSSSYYYKEKVTFILSYIHSPVSWVAPWDTNVNSH